MYREMKKAISILMLLLLAAIPAEAVAKKKSSTAKRTRVATTTTTTTPSVVAGETKTYGDYLTTRVYKIRNGNSLISVEYPVEGNQQLVDAIRAWLKLNVARKSDDAVDTPEALLKSGLSTIDKGDEKTQVITVKYTDDKVITMLDDTVINMGRPPMASLTGATFRLDDGLQLTGVMLPDIRSIRPFFNEELAKSVKTTPEQLAGQLYVDPDEINYSENIYRNDKGVVVQFAEYELGPYTIGMPAVIIPVTEEFISAFSPEGRTFFE